MCAIWANLLTGGGCQVVQWVGDGIGAVAGGVTSSVFDSMAEASGHAAGQMITRSISWWTFKSSVDFGSPAFTYIRAYTRPLQLILLVVGVVFSAARTALSRRGEPLVSLATNLVGYMVVSLAGLGLMSAIQAGGDAFSGWIMTVSGAELGDKLAKAAAAGGVAAFAEIILSLCCILIAFVQWILMLFRSGVLVVLGGIWPLAAATSVLQGRPDSLRKVAIWALAILLYKPIAAIVYACGFLTIGGSDNLIMLLQGVVILLMAIITLPTLVKLFAWSSTSAGGGGGGGMAAAAGLAGILLSRVGTGGGGASDPWSMSVTTTTQTTGYSDQQQQTNDTAQQHADEMYASGPGSGGGGHDVPADSGGEGAGRTSGATGRISGSLDDDDESAAATAATGGAGAAAAGDGGGAASEGGSAAGVDAPSESGSATEHIQAASEQAGDGMGPERPA